MSPLAAVALELAPELAIGLFGSSADATLRAVEDAMRTAAGTGDVASVQQVLARDPQAASRLRIELARVAVSAQQAELRASLEVLGQPKLSTAPGWAAPVISALVLVSFAAAMCGVLTRGLPGGSEGVMTMLLGTLAAMATSVVSYWVGSSAGSATKTGLLFDAKRMPATTPPAGQP